MAPKSKLTRSKPSALRSKSFIGAGSHALVRRVWPILIIFLVVIALIIGGVIALLRRNATTSQATTFTSQPLSDEAQASLRVAPLAPEDYLIGGNLDIAGALGVNTITSSADMLIGSTEHAVLLQGNDISLAVTSGEITNTLRFAAPSGVNKTIVLPNASGTIAVSASGPLVLDASGNLSCPSCTAATQAGETNLTTFVTNNYSTSTINMVSLTAGDGVAISEQDGTSTISVVGVASQSLSNLSNVAINTDLLPGADNAVDVGSVAATFRSGYYGTSVHSASFDTASSGQLNIGTSTATNISLGADTTIAAGKNLTVNGAALFKNNANSATAFQIQDSAGVALLNANTSQGTLSVGTYVPTTVWSQPAMTTNDYVVSNPQSITSADFNGDGHIDLATANVTSNTMSVFLNNGDGTFAAKVDYATGTTPQSVTTADFNGDGKADLATANSNSNTMSVFLNNGDGTFAAKVDYATANGPRSVTSADFNGDGNIDLVTVNTSISNMSVFINNGNGTFAPKVDYVTGGSPYSVVSDDVNGDNIADLIVANANGSTNSVSVFIGNGNGTFAPKVDYGVGNSPQSVTSADFNGDGKADLATANWGDTTISVLIGNGDGTFAPKVNYLATTGLSSIIDVDFNGDGIIDLVTANSGVSVFIGNGNGTFAPKVDYAISGSGSRSVTSADFNGDGKADLATANWASSRMSVIFIGIMTSSVMTQSVSKVVINASANSVGQIIQGTLAQAADLLQVRNDINTILFGVSATGNVAVAGALNATGIITASSSMNVVGTFTASSSMNVVGTFTATGGGATFRNSVNSSTAFQIQQANLTTVFRVDTTNGRVGIGSAAPAHKLSVNALTTATGNTTAQVAIGTSVAGNKGLIVQGVLNQTADLLQAQSSTGTVLASISATGTLTVASAVFNGNITINGHIVTGGTTPTITADTAACATPTVSTTGNDTSGTITITTGTACSVIGSMATVTFNGPFGTTPRIILTPNNASATDLKWYNGNATTTTFTIDTAAIPTDTTTYTFNYWAVQ